MNTKTRQLKNQDNTLFGTKIYDYEKKCIGLIICTWDNTFWTSEGEKDIPYVNYVDINGKRNANEMDKITPIESMDEEELIRLGLN